MLSTLIKTLDGVWCETKLELLDRLNKLFLSYEYETPGIAVNYLLQQVGSQPTDDTLYRIMTVLEENVDILLLNHTIGLQNATLQEKIFILESVRLIEDFEDQERIYYLCEDDSDDVDSRDRFVEIISFVSGVSSDNFEHYVWSVHDSFIDKCLEIAKANLDGYDYDVLNSPSIERVELFKSYITKYGRGAATLAIEAGYRLNVNYSFLLDNNTAMLSSMEPHDSKFAAISIVGLLIMSDTPLEDIRKKSNITVSQIYQTPVFKTAVLNHISSILAEVGING